MKFGYKITALACASALALAGVVPAFAEDTAALNKNGDSADVKISAAVAKEGEKIVSVTVPSQMAIAITTDKTNGTFKEAMGADATVTNNAISNTSVKVDIAKVSQVAGADSNATLLELVDLKLTGADANNPVTLSESTKDVTLFDNIAPKGSYALKLTAEANAANKSIPTDSYTVNTTLKVTAV